MFVCRVGRNYNCDKATNQYEYNGHLPYIMILISVLIMVILFFYSRYFTEKHII